MSAQYDLKSAVSGAPSIMPGSTVLSGTGANNGSWIDADLINGPVYGEFSLGAVAGTPTSFTVTGKLQEATDSSGTGAQDIAGQDTIVLTAEKTRGMARGQRTMRYIRCVATPAFTGGTTPTIPSAASVVGVARRVNNSQT